MYQGDWYETYQRWYIFYHRLRVPLDNFALDIFIPSSISFRRKHLTHIAERGSQCWHDIC